jgi:hypothetical protein
MDGGGWRSGVQGPESEYICSLKFSGFAVRIILPPENPMNRAKSSLIKVNQGESSSIKVNFFISKNATHSQFRRHRPARCFGATNRAA